MPDRFGQPVRFVKIHNQYAIERNGMNPDVYYSKLKKGRSLSDCFHLLINGIEGHTSETRKGAIVGIKMTIGDEKSTGYIKPEIVKILVDTLRKQGAKTFVFDTNVIYSGHRRNAVDHLNLAYDKGFTPSRLGCPFIIADGVFGTDSRSIKVGFNNVKEIKTPSMIKLLDDLIVLTHLPGTLCQALQGP